MGHSSKTLVLAIVLISAVEGSTESRVRPATLAELAGVWVGCEPGSAGDYFRLELDDKGAGLLTVFWAPDQTQAYRVTATQLEGYAVNFGLQGVEATAQPMYLRGRATVRRLELEVGGTTPEWKRKLLLDRYSDFMARLNAVTRRAEEYRATLRE